MKLGNVNCKYFILLPLLLTATFGFAGGNKTYGVSARAESMGGAFVAVADDASAVYYNPAGLLQIKEKGMIMDLSPIMPRSRYTNGNNGVTVNNSLPAVGLSNFFAKRMNDNIAVGAGIYAPFARGTKYRASPALYNFKVKTLFVDLHVAAVVAFKAFEKLTIGMGPILNVDLVNINAFGTKQNAIGTGVSAVFSGLYTLNDFWKIGLTYHTQSSMNNSGHGAAYAYPNPIYFRDHFHLKYKNPAHLDGGISLQATHDLLVAFGAGMEFWHQAKNARYFYRNRNYDNLMTFDSKDSWNIHAGIEYFFQPQKVLRLGYAYFQRATPAEGLLPGALDFGANVFSIGFGYHYNNTWRWNLGYEYVMSRDVISTVPIHNPFVGRYHARVNTILLGVNYQI